MALGVQFGTLQSKCAPSMLRSWLLSARVTLRLRHVPLLPYHRPGDPALAALAATTVNQCGERGTPIRAVMLARLGPNVWHDSVEAAAAVLEEMEELEETARLAMLLQPEPAPLDEAAAAELRQHFGALW